MCRKLIIVAIIVTLTAIGFGCRKKPATSRAPETPSKTGVKSQPKYNETSQKEIDAINKQAELLRTSGRPDEAIEHLQRALKMNPSYAKTHNNLGCALRDKKQLPEAMAEFERAISLDPNYVNAFNNYGVVLAEQERYEDAIKRFGEALAISPQFQGALINLWQAGLTSEKMDEVLKVLLSLEQKFPDNAEFYYRAGVIYYKDNKIEEAIKQLEKAVELRPDFAEARGTFGDALVHASRYKDAAKQFEAAMQLDPQNAEVLSSYALLLAGSPDPNMRDLDLATSLAEEACRLTDYNDGESLDVLSQVYFGRGELENAIKTSQKAVEAANRAGEGSLSGRYKMRLEKYEQVKGGK